MYIHGRPIEKQSAGHMNHVGNLSSPQASAYLMLHEEATQHYLLHC